MLLVKVRSLEGGLKCNDCVLRRGQTQGEGRCDNRGRDRRDAATSPGTSRTVGNVRSWKRHRILLPEPPEGACKDPTLILDLGPHELTEFLLL